MNPAGELMEGWIGMLRVSAGVGFLSSPPGANATGDRDWILSLQRE